MVRVITATPRVALRLSRAPWLLALQLLQFGVNRAQTPLTGDVRPPPHHEGAPQDAGPPLAAGGVLQVGEPTMDGMQHRGPPCVRSNSRRATKPSNNRAIPVA